MKNGVAVLCSAKVSIYDINYEMLSIIRKEYLRNPLLYAYVFYDIMYELDRTYIVFKIKDRKIIGFALLWKGMVPNGLHLYGDFEDLIGELDLDKETFIMVYSLEGLSRRSKEVFMRKGSLENSGTYLDMVVDSEHFRPYYPEKAVRLRREHAAEFMEVKKEQGREISVEEALKRLSKYRYYGVFFEGKLASIACAYLITPEVWIIGDVYTREKFRGRGFGKIVASAITRDAIRCSGKAMLHVREDSKPAIKVYTKLGYRAVSKRRWYYFKPKPMG